MIDRLREAAQALVDDAGTPDRFDPMTSTFVHDAQLQALREALVATEPAVMRESAAMRHAAADLHCATARLDKLLAEPVAPAGLVHDEASAFERGAIAAALALNEVLESGESPLDDMPVDEEGNQEITPHELLVRLGVLPDTATPEPSAADLLAAMLKWASHEDSLQRKATLSVGADHEPRFRFKLERTAGDMTESRTEIRNAEDAAGLMRVLSGMAPDDGAGELAGRDEDGGAWR